ncbi:Protein LONGIFOLIA like [Melia azedarach]|uniref:Protein LONGIFOLIA like n=1 Tax=Melia azedarach TaxID=155640 RepID=A0ACC1X7A5_MELAZ|nr:Protein LONGIFOLIA like [Melia azedarach]
MDVNHFFNSREPSFSSENDYNKLENMKHLDQDDMHINSAQDASIYDSTDLNHRYISEILLASVLEQTKARTRLPSDENKVLQESSKMWFSPSKLADKRSSGQQLLRDLCSEVDHLQANNSNCNLDDEDDILRSIMYEDLMHGAMDWTDGQSEISHLVLYVERLIFRDLISEIVRDETADLRGHPVRYCRQLFSK